MLNRCRCYSQQETGMVVLTLRFAYFYIYSCSPSHLPLTEIRKARENRDCRLTIITRFIRIFSRSSRNSLFEFSYTLTHKLFSEFSPELPGNRFIKHTLCVAIGNQTIDSVRFFFLIFHDKNYSYVYRL